MKLETFKSVIKLLNYIIMSVWTIFKGSFSRDQMWYKVCHSKIPRTRGTLNLDWLCTIPLCDRKRIKVSFSSRSWTFTIYNFWSSNATTKSPTFDSLLIEGTVQSSPSPTKLIVLDSLLTERLSNYFPLATAFNKPN